MHQPEHQMATVLKVKVKEIIPVCEALHADHPSNQSSSTRDRQRKMVKMLKIL